MNAQRHFECYSNSLVIRVVDNEATRCKLANIQGALWLDCGNFKNVGQVILGNLGDCDAMLRHMKEKTDKYLYLPHAGLLLMMRKHGWHDYLQEEKTQKLSGTAYDMSGTTDAIKFVQL